MRLADGVTVPVPSRLRGQVAEGQAVLLASAGRHQPRGPRVNESGEGAAVDLTVILAEPLGMESLIYTTLAGQEVQAKLYGPRIVQPGERLPFRLALDRAHLFDAATTRALEG